MKLKNRNIYSLAAMIIGAVMMAFGIYRGEMEEVFTKAVRICLECIGIG